MDSVWKEAFNLLCGPRIGVGAHREVFECSIRDDLVVKVEAGDFRYFANVMEMRFWDEHQHCKQIAKWLAPCEYISPDGRVLLQRKCDPVPTCWSLPDKLPAFLSDRKVENLGLLDGRLVCVDYAMTVSNPSLRLRKW